MTQEILFALESKSVSTESLYSETANEITDVSKMQWQPSGNFQTLILGF